jgi:hypothetical protein
MQVPTDVYDNSFQLTSTTRFKRILADPTDQVGSASNVTEKTHPPEPTEAGAVSITIEVFD